MWEHHGITCHQAKIDAENKSHGISHQFNFAAMIMSKRLETFGTSYGMLPLSTIAVAEGWSCYNSPSLNDCPHQSGTRNEHPADVKVSG